MSCRTCDHAAENGWWGVNGITHCRDCHATWPLSKTRWQHCSRCHETFGGDEAASRHVARNGACLNPAKVKHSKTKAAVLSRNADGVWVRAYGKEAKR